MPCSLWPHELQHTGLPCPSLPLRVCSDSCPLSGWCCLTICPLLPPSPFAFNLSQHQDHFQWVSSSHQMAKVWSFSFSIKTSNEYSGLISFKIDWFDLLAVQGTLKSLLQHHNSKAPILRCSAFFMVQLSHLYRTTRKVTDLTIQIFVSTIVSLFLNKLSRFVIAFLPRRKEISWLQSLSALILELKKIKSALLLSSYLPWSDRTRCHDQVESGNYNIIW